MNGAECRFCAEPIRYAVRIWGEGWEHVGHSDHAAVVGYIGRHRR